MIHIAPPQKNTVKSLPGKNKGYTLLFAVIVSTLVLSIGLSILNIARKELLLTSAAQESEKAVYAADAGIECGYYLDTVAGSFLYPENPSVRPTATRPTVTCDQNSITVPVLPVSYIDESDNNQYWSLQYGPFSFSSGNQTLNPQCATVTITKRFQWNKIVSLFVPITIIESRGYNAPYNAYAGGNCRDYYEYKVERAIRIVY